MLLRNHGFDTITLCFSKAKHQDSSTTYSSDELENLHRTLMRLSAGSKVKEKIDQFYKVLSYEFFINEKIKCYTNVYSSTLEFSLSTLVHGHNVDGLDIQEIPIAIDILEQLIGINPRKAIIKRIDYCFNFGANMLMSLMHDYITTSTKRLRRSTEEHSLYFKNKSREVCLYSQVDKFNNSIYADYVQEIKETLHVSDLIRVECRIKKEVFKKLKFTLDDIIQHTFHFFLANQIFETIDDISFNNPECLENKHYEIKYCSGMTSDEFFDECLSKLISIEGYFQLWRQAHQNRNQFRSYYHYKRVLRRLEKALQSLNGPAIGCERLDEIPDNIFYALFQLGWFEIQKENDSVSYEN